MRFTQTTIAGVVLVEAEPRHDERGAFARLHCPEQFTAAGHPFVPVQTSLSRNPTRHTLRGLHYQRNPHGETKLVRVAQGRVFDVAIDLRPQSPTFRRWTAAELSADAMNALLIPEGVAHGFLTLEPDTDVLYQIAPAYRPGHEAGVRWDDPAFAIDWPYAPALLSDRDATYPDFLAGSAGDAED
jgi:dTDP-4-dehydrorhamnose 3,5-epimerase